MLIPMLVPAIFTSALIFGPAFVIVLALCLALLVRFPSFKIWVGAALVAIGLIEILLIPILVLGLFFIGFGTSIFGIALLGSALPSSRKSGLAGIILVVLGALGIVAFATGFFGGNFWAFIFSMIVLVFGIAGVAALLREQRRVKIGLVMTALGFAAILAGILTSFVALTFFIGLVIAFAGVSVVVSGLPCWTRNRAGGTVRCLKKVLYVLLAVAVLSSAFVISLRTTNVLREELYDNWTLNTTADTTVSGVVTGIYLNYEADIHGYSYHIFPALIIMNVTEVLKAGEIWTNLSEAEVQWVNHNMIVGYDKLDVPNLMVGQRVEASGYYDMLIEDPTSFTSKLVVAAKIDGSYVTPLQG